MPLTLESDFFFFPEIKQFFSVIDGSSTATEESSQSFPLSSLLMGGPRPIPLLNHTRTEKVSGRKGFSKRCRLPVRTKIYTLTELQSTTNKFSQENLLGEGSLGAVYRAEFPDGQVKIMIPIRAKFVLTCMNIFLTSNFKPGFGGEKYQHGRALVYRRRAISGCGMDCFPFEAPKHCYTAWILCRAWTTYTRI